VICYSKLHSVYTMLCCNGRVRQGFHTPLSYVLTQLPLKETVDDFWHMVVEERCHTIVLLDAVGNDEVSRIRVVA